MDTELLRYYIFDIVLPELWTTIVILFFTMIFTILAGTFLGSVLYMTDPDGLTPKPLFNKLLGLIVNIIRSVPVIIFMVLMIPASRAILGTAIGARAAIFTISIMCTPFMSRVVEGRLKDIQPSLIEAAKSMGLSNLQILTRVVIHASIPSLIAGYSFASVIFLGVIALAGTIGAGGIGAVAMNYGYKAFNDYVMYGSILLLAVMVILLQFLGRILYRKTS